MKRNIFLGFVILLSVLVKAQPITNGLVGYWPFNGNANDESGFNNHGTVNGATLSTDRFGNLNSAYYFDGINDFISITSNALLYRFNTSFTITAWVRRTDSPTNFTDPIFTNRTSSAGSEFGIDGPLNGFTDKLVYATLNSSGTYGICRSNNVVPKNDYHFVVLVYDYQGSNNNIAKLYIDGVLDGVATNLINIPLSTADTYIGWGPSLVENERHFDGDIDDIGLFNRALTVSEIDTIFNEVPTGINNYNTVRLGMVYPNPTTGFVNIQMNLIGEKQITIINSIGEVIAHEVNDSNKMTFDISQYPSGLYFVMINTNGKTETIKIVKE